jgi:hypothetical protein
MVDGEQEGGISGLGAVSLGAPARVCSVLPARRKPSVFPQQTHTQTHASGENVAMVNA